MSVKKKISKAIDLAGSDPTNLSKTVKMASVHHDCPDGLAFVSSMKRSGNEPIGMVVEGKFGELAMFCSESIEPAARRAMQFFEESAKHKGDRIDKDSDEFFEKLLQKVECLPSDTFAAVWKIDDKCYLFHSDEVFVDIQTRKGAIYEHLYHFLSRADAPTVDNSEDKSLGVRKFLMFTVLSNTRIIITNSPEIPSDFPENLSMQSILVPTEKKHEKLRKQLPGASGSDGMILLEFREKETERDIKRKTSKSFVAIAAVVVLVAVIAVFAALKGNKTAEETVANNTTENKECPTSNSSVPFEASSAKSKDNSDCSTKENSTVNAISPGQTRSNESARSEMAPSANGNKSDCEFYIENANPQVLKAAKPQKPESLKGTEGIVVVEVSVDSKGNVQTAKVLKSSEDKLNQIALETSKKYLFRPAYKDGKPIDSSSKITIRFGAE